MSIKESKEITTITIGSRKSKLALWQTEHVAAILAAAGLSSRIVSMETIGDKNLATSIAKIGSKGVFTVELEEQLQSGTTDIAVHSAKDMQSILPEGFELIAFTEREKVHDVLLAKQEIDIDDTKKSLTIGTSSVRRRALLRHYYPHIKLVEMRGNLQTRIAKMEAGACDALMLAYAGVVRMGYQQMIAKEFDPTLFIPPVGQGCIAVEAATSLDAAKRKGIRTAVNNRESEICLMAERGFLQKLEGGCSIPAFGHARLQKDQLILHVGLASLDGKTILRKKKEVTLGDTPLKEATALGIELGQDILEQGGKELLQEIRRQQANQ